MRPQAARRRPSSVPAGHRTRRIRSSGRVVTFGLVVWAGVAGLARAQTTPPPSFEPEVKASFVYTVTKFVDWPAAAFVDPGAPLVLEILGDDPIQDSLLKTVAGKMVGGHPVQVIRARDEEDLVPCHVLFVGRSESTRVDEIIGRLQGASVLTVGDFDRFAQRGGVLRLSLVENMVRFEVNVDAAERAHLQISSKILKLGKVIRDRRHVVGAP